MTRIPKSAPLPFQQMPMTANKIVKRSAEQEKSIDFSDE